MDDYWAHHAQHRHHEESISHEVIQDHGSPPVLETRSQYIDIQSVDTTICAEAWVSGVNATAIGWLSAKIGSTTSEITSPIVSVALSPTVWLPLRTQLKVGNNNNLPQLHLSMPDGGSGTMSIDDVQVWPSDGGCVF